MSSPDGGNAGGNVSNPSNINAGANGTVNNTTSSEFLAY